MTSLLNSPCPEPTGSAHPDAAAAYPELFAELNAAVAALRDEKHVGVFFAPARAQLLPNDSRYQQAMRELPDVGFCDILIDISDSAVDARYRSSDGFAFRVSWVASEDGRRLILYGLLALTPTEHFVLGCASWRPAWVGAGYVWSEGKAPAGMEGTKNALLTFVHATHDLFVKERLPREAVTLYGKCADHTGRPCACKFEAIAETAAAERAIFADAVAALRSKKDILPEHAAAAERLLSFPITPALPWAPPTSGTPDVVPTGALHPATSAWEAVCAVGAGGVASLPLWSGLLAPELVAALAGGPSALAALLHTEIPGAVWSFPIFSPEGCAALINVTEQTWSSAERRGVCFSAPNTMNRFGSVLRQCGLAPFLRALIAAVLSPVAEVALPLESMPSGGFTRVHAFTVAYDTQEGCDRYLDMHTDASDVTFNVCLGKEFTGATLSFCGAKGAADHRHLALRYEHVVGRCVVHRGLQRHGADDITSGHRRNLIVWLFNDILRTLPCRQARWEEDAGDVDPVCMSFTHDKDWDTKGPDGGALPLPAGAVRGPRPWCPEVTGSVFELK